MAEEKNRSNQFVDFFIVWILLGLILCLAGNIFGMELAIMKNDQACQKVAMFVSQTVFAGDNDRDSLEKAASQAIDSFGPESFLLSTPQLVLVNDDEKNGQHKLTVGTRILAKIPAPLLLFFSGREDKLEFRRIYVLNMPEASESNNNTDLHAPRGSR